jgi:HEAT repeat protein
VAPLLKSEDVEIRMRALQCLPALEATTQDLALIIPLAEDNSPQVRQEVGGALIHIGNGQEKEKVIPALIKLLKDEEYKVIERTLRSMWGQYSSPEFDALLIELSRHPRHRGHVIYHCLSTMRTKSPEVCRRLIEELDEPNWNDSGRAAWGLTYGVVKEAYSLVEEGLLKALPEETNSYTRKQEFRALRRVVTEKSRPYLKSVVDSEMETEEFKGLARQILTDLDRK